MFETFNGQGHMSTLQIGIWLHLRDLKKNTKLVRLQNFAEEKGWEVKGWWTNKFSLGINLNDNEQIKCISDPQQCESLVHSTVEKIERYLIENEQDFFELERLLLGE